MSEDKTASVGTCGQCGYPAGFGANQCASAIARGNALRVECDIRTIAKLRAENEALRARVAEHEQLVDALRWLPANCTVSFTDLEGFLEEVRDMGWVPGTGEADDDDTETAATKDGE